MKRVSTLFKILICLVIMSMPSATVLIPVTFKMYAHTTVCIAMIYIHNV